MACEVLRDLGIGKFKIKLNHRCILDAVMALCGVPDVKYATCPALTVSPSMQQSHFRLVLTCGLRPLVVQCSHTVCTFCVAVVVLSWWPE